MNKKIINMYFLLLGCALRYNLVSFLYLLFLLGLPLIPAPSALTLRGKTVHATGAACCNVFIKFIDIIPQKEDLYFNISACLLVDWLGNTKIYIALDSIILRNTVIIFLHFHKIKFFPRLQFLLILGSSFNIQAPLMI